jgi:hypothetical protein
LYWAGVADFGGVEVVVVGGLSGGEVEGVASDLGAGALVEFVGCLLWVVGVELVDEFGELFWLG